MAQPAWLKKYILMKPEVKKIFEDLEEWRMHCCWTLTKFDERDLYKSKEYKEFSRSKK